MYMYVSELKETYQESFVLSFLMLYRCLLLYILLEMKFFITAVSSHFLLFID